MVVGVSPKSEKVVTPRFSRTVGKLPPLPRFVREDWETPADRCAYCSKEDLWILFDVFCSMDKQNRKRISRREFLEALADETSQAKLRTLRRSGLHQRFRESAADVTLEEFFKLMWPKATQDDMAKLLRWVKLREAQSVLREQQFKGDNHELRKIFDLLDENGDGVLSVRELQRSEILTKDEICQIMGSGRLDAQVNWSDFLSFVQPHLKKMYMTAETRMLEERAGQEADAENFQSQFRGLMAQNLKKS